jgi:hypothetical protein
VSAHTHTTHTPGCYRCDLSRYEYLDELAELEAECERLRSEADNSRRSAEQRKEWCQREADLADELAGALADMWCPNCDDRKCMACVCRDIHERCDDDCMTCCAMPGIRVTDGSPSRYAARTTALAKWRDARKWHGARK